MQAFDVILRGWKAPSTSSTPVYGYWAGGRTNGAPWLTEVDRIVFSTSIIAANTSSVATALYFTVGVSDGSTYGYFCGGYTGAIWSSVSRILLSTSAISANSSSLTVPTYASAALGDGVTYGYVAGGYSGAMYSGVNILTFSTSVFAANASKLSSTRYQLTGISDGSTYGYFDGGTTGGPPYVTTSDMITFSTSTLAAHTATQLSTGKIGTAGVSDGSTYGYFSGGASSGPVYLATTDRVIFSTSTISTSTTWSLKNIKNNMGGISDGSTYGYVGGGQSPSYTATVEKLTFSSSTYSTSTTSNLNLISARTSCYGCSDSKV